MLRNNYSPSSSGFVHSANPSVGAINRIENEDSIFPIPLCTNTRYRFDAGVPLGARFILVDHSGEIINSMIVSSGVMRCTIITTRSDINLFEINHFESDNELETSDDELEIENDQAISETISVPSDELLACLDGTNIEHCSSDSECDNLKPFGDIIPDISHS